MITHCFSTNALRVYHDTIVEQASVFVDELKEIGNGEIDILHHATMHVFHATLGNVK